MNERAALTQSTKPALSRRVAAARWLRAREDLQPRWCRPVLRFGAAMLRHRLPQGVGSSAVALLLLASVCYGVVRGDHIRTLFANLHDIGDSAANAMGFGITEIALDGQHNLSRDAILVSAGITGNTSLFFLDAHATRARLMTNPWVADATVLKLYPSRLRIGIVERKPFALWQKEGRVSLIAADGTVLEPYAPRRFFSLPLVVGTDARQEAKDFLSLVRRYPVIAEHLKASVLVARRRWNLYLKDGLEIMLPEGDPARALRTLVNLARSKKLLSRDIVDVDLRLSDRVTVRLSDTAWAARQDAIKAAEKKRKARRKGGEA